MVWSSSGRYAVNARARRPRRFRRRLRTGALLAAFGLIGAARLIRARHRLALGLSGTVLTVTGITLPRAGLLVSGIVVLLVTLLLPSDPARTVACNAGFPRLWAEPCLPFFAAPPRPGDRR